MQHPAPQAQGDIATLVQRLGYAGLIPFVGLAGLMWLVSGDVHAFVAMALSAYAATIAAFLGGIHWGMGLPLDAAARRFHLVWGVIPSLVAWVALLMPAYAGLPLLALLLVVCYGVDRRSWAQWGWADWLPLRARLTAVSVLSCLLGASAT
jgi:hypothetical protein